MLDGVLDQVVGNLHVDLLVHVEVTGYRRQLVNFAQKFALTDDDFEGLEYFSDYLIQLLARHKNRFGLKVFVHYLHLGQLRLDIELQDFS